MKVNNESPKDTTVIQSRSSPYVVNSNQIHQSTPSELSNSLILKIKSVSKDLIPEASFARYSALRSNRRQLKSLAEIALEAEF